MRPATMTTTAAPRQPTLSVVPFPVEALRPPRARVRPASRREMGFVNTLVCGWLARVAAGPPPRVFTTIAHHRRLFRAWLHFGLRMMPYGTLATADTELVILRVATLCGSDYEWNQHVALGQRAGLSVEQIARVGDGADADGWSDRQRTLLRATDALVERKALDDATWSRLRGFCSERELIELCLLVGQYAMLAATLNALGVEPEARAVSRMPRR